MAEHAHSEDQGAGHATVGFYTAVAVILFIITVCEVGFLYPPLNSFPQYFKVACLVILSLAKFVTVVAFFMHLYFDAPICTSLFTLGMVLAAGTMVALIHLFPPPKNPLRPHGKQHKTEQQALAPEHVQARLRQMQPLHLS